MSDTLYKEKSDSADSIDQNDGKQNKNKPFFAYITTNAPHGPFYCPKNYTKLYENNPNVPNVPFYGMITNIDDNIGKLMSFLDDENLRNNTILIYMTDNGTSAGVKWNNSTKKNLMSLR